MNPVFILLVIIGVILLWFLLAFAFKPIGNLFYKLGKDAVDQMSDKKTKKRRKKMSSKGLLGGVILGGVLIVGTVGAFMCSEKVPAGYVGIVYNMNGGIDGEVLTQGWHLVAPTKKVTTYSIKIWRN